VSVIRVRGYPLLLFQLPTDYCLLCSAWRRIRIPCLPAGPEPSMVQGRQAQSEI
jgi:hypothetical protein